MKRMSQRAALHEIKGAGLTVAQVWEGYQKSLRAPLPTGTSLFQTVDDFLSAKRQANRRPAYVDGLKYELNRMARHIGGNRLVTSICSDELRTYFASYDETPKARIATMGKVKSFFSWAFKSGYLVIDPATGLEKPMVDHDLPEIIPLEDCERLMAWAVSNGALATTYWCFRLFLGIRASEFARLTVDNIFEQVEYFGHIRIPASAAKTRRPRLIDVPVNVAAMLNDVGGMRFALRHEVKELVYPLMNWKPEAVRHTAASYLVSKLESAEKAALQLGNSAPTLHKYYLNPIPPADVERFYKIGL